MKVVAFAQLLEGKQLTCIINANTKQIKYHTYIIKKANCCKINWFNICSMADVVDVLVYSSLISLKNVFPRESTFLAQVVFFQ